MTSIGNRPVNVPLAVGASAAGVVGVGAAVALKARNPLVAGVAALAGIGGAAALGAAALGEAPVKAAGPRTASGPTPDAGPAEGQTVTGSAAPGRSEAPKVRTREIATGLEQPVHVTHAPGDEALYVVQQGGQLMRVEDGRAEQVVDISGRIRSGGEQGFLSVAFHPDFQQNGKLYGYYNNPSGDIAIGEMKMRDGKVDERSIREIATFDHPPAGNHNGGQLQFGPDGMLYIATGDGGGGGDPQARAQNPNDHMGKMLRIDVDNPEGGKAYGIPDDNPFADGGGKPEVYSTGLRNPWRFSFDAKNGDMWIGDVGQNALEEVDYVPKGAGLGANFGWDVREGSRSFERKDFGPGRVVDPVLQYGRDEGASVAGGFVYRGEKYPDMQGWYVYTDIFGGSNLRLIKQEDGKVVDRAKVDVDHENISSFGEGNDGELYAVTLDGKVLAVEQDR